MRHIVQSVGVLMKTSASTLGWKEFKVVGEKINSFYLKKPNFPSQQLCWTDHPPLEQPWSKIAILVSFLLLLLHYLQTLTEHLTSHFSRLLCFFLILTHFQPYWNVLLDLCASLAPDVKRMPTLDLCHVSLSRPVPSFWCIISPTNPLDGHHCRALYNVFLYLNKICLGYRILKNALINY